MFKNILLIFIISFTLLTCKTTKESDFIDALNRYDKEKLIDITLSGFTLNGKPFNKENIERMVYDNRNSKINYITDSIITLSDSSTIYAKWTSAISNKYNLSPYYTIIVLKYQNDKIKSARFQEPIDDVSNGEYDKLFEAYLLWLEDKYPDIYNRMAELGNQVLVNDSLYSEYNRLLHLKLEEYHPR